MRKQIAIEPRSEKPSQPVEYKHEVNGCEVVNSPTTLSWWSPCLILDGPTNRGQVYVQPKGGSPFWAFEKNVRPLKS